MPPYMGVAMYTVGRRGLLPEFRPAPASGSQESDQPSRNYMTVTDWPARDNRGRLRPVSMSMSTITAPARDAICTRSCCGGSPSAAIGKSSSASPNPTRPATAFIDPSGSRTPACTAAWHGSTTAGTTWHGCNSICLTLAARMDRRARFADPRPATYGPLRNRQCAMPRSTDFAKVEPWTRRPPAVP